MTTGLPRARYCNPRTYVVQADLRELPQGLAKTNAAELRQWSKLDELPPTALAIAAVLYAFTGLRRGPHGCGTQAPLEAWARLLGCSRRMVAYGFEALEAAGWASRRRRLVRHEWTDEAGHTWQRCDVHGVAYLLPKGAVRIARRGETRRGRRLMSEGVVGKLLRVAGLRLRMLARRVTDAPNGCTPSFGVKQDNYFNSRRAARCGESGKLRSARLVRAHSTAPPGQRLAGRQHLTGTAYLQRRWPQTWGVVVTELAAYRAAVDDRAREWFIREWTRRELAALVASKKS